MNLRRSISLLTLGLALTGCSVVEPHEAEVENSAGCAMVNPYGANPNTQRFHHYRTNVDMGDPLPRSVSTRGGSATQTWVGRGYRTARVDTGFSILTLLLVPWIALMIIAPFMLLILIALLTQKENPASTQALAGSYVANKGTQPGYAKRFAIYTAGAVVAMFLCSYFSGSVVSIDNPSMLPLDVTVDGRLVRIPAQSFVDLRVWGSSVDIDVRSNNQLIESATAHVDDGFGSGLRRLLIGNGRFVYSVCGLNTYSLQTAHYSR